MIINNSGLITIGLCLSFIYSGTFKIVFKNKYFIYHKLLLIVSVSIISQCILRLVQIKYQQDNVNDINVTSEFPIYCIFEAIVKCLLVQLSYIRFKSVIINYEKHKKTYNLFNIFIISIIGIIEIIRFILDFVGLQENNWNVIKWNPSYINYIVTILAKSNVIFYSIFISFYEIIFTFFLYKNILKRLKNSDIKDKKILILKTLIILSQLLISFILDILKVILDNYNNLGSISINYLSYSFKFYQFSEYGIIIQEMLKIKKYNLLNESEV